jgi:hypothetical protein
MLVHNPEVQKTVEALKVEFPRIRDKDLWTLTILRNPRFGILLSSPDWTDPIESPRDDFRAVDSFDHNDKNWWCPLEPDRHLAAIRRHYDEASGLHRTASYHQDKLKPLLEDDALSKAAAARDQALKAHPMMKSVSWREVRRLAEAPSAPKLLSRQAIALAKAGRLPKAAPEALGRAVVTTRYGCSWHGRHGAYSKAAQLLLKQKFPQSEWAVRTPYWFDCMASSFDANYNRVVDCKAKEWPKQEPLR